MFRGQGLQVPRRYLMVGVQFLIAPAEFLPPAFHLTELAVEFLVIGQRGQVIGGRVQLGLEFPGADAEVWSSAPDLLGACSPVDQVPGAPGLPGRLGAAQEVTGLAALPMPASTTAMSSSHCCRSVPRRSPCAVGVLG